MEGRPVVVLSSHAACESVLRDPRASNDRGHALIHAGSETAELPSFLFMDPPEHTRLRRAAAHAFTPRSVRSLEPMVRELVDDLIDAVADRGSMDAIDDFASPLPVTVICRMIGAELRDHTWYRRRSSRLGRSVDPYLALTGAPAPGFRERSRFEAELEGFFTDLARRRRADPRDDVMSALLAAEEGGLTEHEIVTTCRLLLNAGHETTVNLIGNGLLALLRTPELLPALAHGGAAAEQVVEEVLRYDPPLQLVHRHAAEDMDVLGMPVPRGTTMVLILAGANRDSSRFDDPERFRPGRDDANGHLAFGRGTHVCLGAHLARLEGRLAFSRFAQRVIRPRLCDAPLGYRENVVLRGLRALPVRMEGVRPRSVPWGPPAATP
ncbi:MULTISPECIES: cytochrome P450 [unclassified Nocardiopsis]|uniref:cytochrome P450 n=1 Tax=unclassified Nocardiopsis TaxID=2649073 RepID=UPI00210373FB|nr:MULTISPECIES: cytochrome P450 [unclassified Nocardiopsis]